jgi:hypothetical protein
MIGYEAAKRNFDALHTRRIPNGVGAFEEVAAGILERFGDLTVKALTIVVSLTVNTTTEAGFGKDAVVDLALFSLLDLGFKGVNFSPEIFRDLIL